MFERITKSTYFESNPDWVWYDENEFPHLTDAAPPEAVESYEYWKKCYDEAQETGIVYS